MGNLYEQYQSLFAEYKKLVDAYKDLKEMYQQSEKNIVELEKQLANSENECQKLRFAKALGLTEQQKKDNDRKLINLIGKIDKCLNLLNE